MARAVTTKAGFADYHRNRLGYSIGVSYPPDWGEGEIISLQQNDDRVLKAGMTFHMPPLCLKYREFGIGFSESILVTETGCEDSQGCHARLSSSARAAVLSGAVRQLEPGRVLADLAELAKIGHDPAGGVTRTAFSPAFAEAVEWLLDVMRQAGLKARRDAAGNVIGRAGPAGAPAVVIGSHIDTVPSGGRYDGALGVLAGIECARVLAPLVEQGPLALEVIAFADEEGTNVSLFGSRSMTGRLDREVLDGTTGEKLASLMADCGLALDRVSQARRAPSEFSAYLELHIEQGPLLEAAGIPIGVVTAITGCDTACYRIEGAARHAGTTSMLARRDAGRGACRAVCDAYAAFDSMDAPETARMTFGDIRFSPGASNVVPGLADVVSEVRSPDLDTLNRLRQ